MRGPKRLMALFVVLALANASVAVNLCETRSRQAEKLRSLIRCVDGDGSGLDADFLRGASPDDMLRRIRADVVTDVVNEINQSLQDDVIPSLRAAVLRDVAAAVHATVVTQTVEPQTCSDVVEAKCRHPSDRVLSCDGSIVTLQSFTQVSPDLNGCLGFGCNGDVDGHDLVLVAICFEVP